MPAKDRYHDVVKHAHQIRLLVFDPITEEVITWIR